MTLKITVSNGSLAEKLIIQEFNRVSGTPLQTWNLVGWKHTGIYPDLCRYVSQNSLKSCMTRYYQNTLKNYLKGNLYKGCSDLTKTAFRHATSSKIHQ